MPSTQVQNTENLKEFEHVVFQEGFSGTLSFSQESKILYSTDASIYQIEPLGVAFPKNQDDLAAIVRAAQVTNMPLTARGSGSSLAGQAIGAAVIVDCSRYLTKIVDIDLDNHQAIVEPGVILTTLNKAVSKYKLQFGPDPASADRATIGGCIANNATGAHSIVYGMTADHLEEADVILSDGSTVTFRQMPVTDLLNVSTKNGVLADISRTVQDIRVGYEGEIKARWPETWRRVSGYNLNYLLPWTPSQPPFWSEASKTWIGNQNNSSPYPPVKQGTLNLAHILAGSEGTLAIIQQAKLKLVPKPSHTVLVVKAYQSILDACDDVPALLTHQPTAVELIPRSLIQLARAVPAYAPLLSFVSELSISGEDPAALLVVEFSSEDKGELQAKLNWFRQECFIAETDAAQKQVWAVRKVGLGILMSRAGDQKPVAFIEDMAVPVNSLGTFVREMDRILSEHGTQADYYAHASAGCLHIRPILDLKSHSGVGDLRSIAEKAVNLTLSLQGAVSAEHGDGLARSEWIEQAYGRKIKQAFQLLKDAADPKGLFNPGKIINPEPMDMHLRYGEDYHTKTWIPVLRYGQSSNSAQKDLASAIEQCNGAGVCRKSDGVMCPSFQASQDEMHSTRGRANLLRAMISGRYPYANQSMQAVKTALDLCLACKGCKSECPSGVDIAKLKYEFFEMFYKQSENRHPWRDYLFGYFHFFSKLGYPFRSIVNVVFQNKWFSKMGENVLGLSSKRQLPLFNRESLQNKLIKMDQKSTLDAEKVFFLSDAYTEYFHADTGFAAIELLQRAGCEVLVLPVLGAGRTLISKGFLSPALQHAKKLVTSLKKLDPSGSFPIVAAEPSEIYTLRDEYLDLFSSDPFIMGMSQRAWMVDEFLLRCGPSGKPRLENIVPVKSYDGEEVLLHSHCYQKAQPPADDQFPVGTEATVQFLRAFGVPVKLIDAGCCGMAGAFGYEKVHFDFSQKVGELALFRTIREARAKDGQVRIAVNGVSCYTQVQDGTGCQPVHPVQIIAELL